MDLDAVAQLAAADPRTARQVLSAQRAQADAAARIAAADADADRQLRVTQQQQRLAAEHRATALREKEQVKARRRQRRAERAEHRRCRVNARRVRATAGLAYLGAHVDDAYAAAMYALAVGGAVYGQISAATSRGWPLAAGLVIAAAIEGLALVMALTAQKLRLAGEAARAPRALTWVCAGTAATVNYLGHAGADQTGAVLLAALSLAGIIVWEIRSGARHRLELRVRGLLPEPPAVFGWRRWLRYPHTTLAAWSLDVRDRVSPRAARLLETADIERRLHRAAVDGDRVRRLARRAVKDASKRGDGPAVLAALTRYAEHGRSGPGPVRTNAGRVRTFTPPAATLHHPVDRTAQPQTDPTGGGPQRRPRPRRPLRPTVGSRGPRLRPRSGPAPAEHQLTHGPAGQRSADVPAATPDTASVRSGASAAASPVNSRATDLGLGQDRPARPGPQVVRAAVPDRTAQLAPSAAPEGQAVSGPLASQKRSSDRASSRPVAAPADRSVTRGQPSNVADLMALGRQVRDRLDADGVALSRSVLIKGLRERNIPISTDRATALLAALRRDPRTDPADAGRR